MSGTLLLPVPAGSRRRGQVGARGGGQRRRAGRDQRDARRARPEARRWASCSLRRGARRLGAAGSGNLPLPARIAIANLAAAGHAGDHGSGRAGALPLRRRGARPRSRRGASPAATSRSSRPTAAPRSASGSPARYPDLERGPARRAAGRPRSMPPSCRDPRATATAAAARAARGAGAHPRPSTCPMAPTSCGSRSRCWPIGARRGRAVPPAGERPGERPAAGRAGRRVARVSLNRPEVRNAFNAELIASCGGPSRRSPRRPGGAARGPLAGDGLRLLCRRGHRLAARLHRPVDARRTRAMRPTAGDARRHRRCPVPVIARVQGAALGGGMACARRRRRRRDRRHELRLHRDEAGHHPRRDQPVRAAEDRRGRRPALISYRRAVRCRAGAADRPRPEIVADEAALDARVEELLGEILSAGPTAARAAKALDARAARALAEEALAHTIATSRSSVTSPEGQEGLGAFLDKRGRVVARGVAPASATIAT